MVDDGGLIHRISLPAGGEDEGLRRLILHDLGLNDVVIAFRR
jgi:hypothetical protein